MFQSVIFNLCHVMLVYVSIFNTEVSNVAFSYLY